jgi:hypothetical protein
MSAGKGSKDTRSPDYAKRVSGWDRIFGMNKKDAVESIAKKPTLVEPHINDIKKNDTD